MLHIEINRSVSVLHFFPFSFSIEYHYCNLRQVSHFVEHFFFFQNSIILFHAYGSLLSRDKNVITILTVFTDISGFRKS